MSQEDIDALTGKTKGAELGPLIDACEASYDRRSFSSDKIQGPWRLKYQLDGKKAQRSQKMLAPDKTGFPAYSDFITDEKGRKVFRNIARLSKKRVAVVADVAYEVSEGIPNRQHERVNRGASAVHPHSEECSRPCYVHPARLCKSPPRVLQTV